MKSLSLLFALLIVFKVCNATQEEEPPWDYLEYGPHGWPASFASCDGDRQSPINIPYGYLEPIYYPPFRFKNYDTPPITATLRNNGHTAQKEIYPSKAPRISKGGLKGDYIFAQLHYHWGDSDDHGSEHTINGESFPLEMHLVHFAAKYETIGEAINHSDGLAVLGVLFNITAEDNEALVPIIDGLANIKEAGTITGIAPTFSLADYLPDNKIAFYRYLGGLTTPTCNEVVIWTVFREIVGISSRQLQAFRWLQTEDGDPLWDNYRPPQLLKNRTIGCSKSCLCDKGCAEVVIH